MAAARATTPARKGRENRTAQRRPGKAASGALRSTVRQVIELEQRDDRARSRAGRAADLITAFSGSMVFVGLHAIWFAVWIAANEGLFGLNSFDAYPFGLLTMIVSLEAIFLSTFVLITQNRQAQKSDRRSKVDFEINLIAEREITKLIEMIEDVHKALGISRKRDPELTQMLRRTYVRQLADAVDRAEGKEIPKETESAAGADNRKN